MRAVRSVQAGESPDVVARAMRISRCQKPLHRARERDEALVEQWLKKEYPRIKALAQREKAEIFFGDAAHMRSDHHSGRTWGKKGETPVVETTGARWHRLSCVGRLPTWLDGRRSEFQAFSELRRQTVH